MKHVTPVGLKGRSERFDHQKKSVISLPLHSTFHKTAISLVAIKHEV